MQGPIMHIRSTYETQLEHLHGALTSFCSRYGKRFHHALKIRKDAFTPGEAGPAGFLTGKYKCSDLRRCTPVCADKGIAVLNN